MELGVRINSWWRHQMETFSALLALCAGNSPVTGDFPAQRAVTRKFDVFFDQRPNKRLSKQSWGWWFETISRSSWRQSYDILAYNIWHIFIYIYMYMEIATRVFALLWYDNYWHSATVELGGKINFSVKNWLLIICNIDISHMKYILQDVPVVM